MRLRLPLLALTALLGAAPALLSAQGLTFRAWGFDQSSPDAPPPGFSFAPADAGGRWIVKAESDAPSAPYVLARVDADPAAASPALAVANQPLFRDLAVSVRCKPVSGRSDQSCGLLFRYRDERNHYLVRASALDGSVRLYSVREGRRRQLGSWSGRVTSGSWHQMRVEARGDKFVVHWNGTKVIDTKDTVVQEPGKVGLWTSGDAVTYFDELSANDLL
jgi:hypothetical protein